VTRARALAALLISGVTGLVVGEFAARAGRRAGEPGALAEHVRRIAEEQAALRRVATLVARGAAPEELFAAVTAEAGRVLDADHTSTIRYDPDGAGTVVGAWTSTGAPAPIAVGSRVPLGGRNLATLVFETGRPARIDDYADASGPVAEIAHAWGIRAAVGVPISVEGRLWGVMSAVSASEQTLPEDNEARLAGFTELVATAIANAQARLELRGFAEEQAALRRVATLVARAAAPEDVFAAVTEEVGRVLHTDFASMSRYDPDGVAAVVGAWSRTGAAGPVAVGDRVPRHGRNVHTLVFETGRPARVDDYAYASGYAADLARDKGMHASVGVPISVDGRLWGVVFVSSERAEPLPVDTEVRLAGFTELVATAIANAQARVELRGYADEQAALRRVATLVARAARPEEVFGAVAEEVGRLLDVDLTAMGRYDPDDVVTGVGVWSASGGDQGPGVRMPLGGQNVTTLVFESGRPARIDDYAGTSGLVVDVVREWGVRSSVGVPINVEDRLWGVMVVSSTREQPLPGGTEARLAAFTELIATAIANAESQAQLTASRARIVAAADQARRRIERDLHDGAQQRLVSIALQLQAAQAAVPPEADGLATQLDEVAAEATSALDELRELARGIHPALLAEHGLPPALRTLARRSAVPVELDVQTDRRLPEPIEIAAYYLVAEALTNVVKHAQASTVHVGIYTADGAAGDVLRVRVRDDGRGGADLAGGSGLVGLGDRVEALGGRLWVDSAPGAGTTVRAELPLDTTPRGHLLTERDGKRRSTQAGSS
jgi:signal transduction histidine kinase